MIINLVLIIKRHLLKLPSKMKKALLKMYSLKYLVRMGVLVA